jgi:hypothetical protein
MLWLNKSWRWGRKLRALSSLAIPVLGGYWLYTGVFNHPGGVLVLTAAVIALALAWRMNLTRNKRLGKNGYQKAVLADKPLAYWPLGEAGQKVADSTNLGQDGHLTGGTANVVKAGGWD